MAPGLVCVVDQILAMLQYSLNFVYRDLSAIAAAADFFYKEISNPYVKKIWNLAQRKMLVSADCIGNNAREMLAFKKEECACGHKSSR